MWRLECQIDYLVQGWRKFKTAVKHQT